MGIYKGVLEELLEAVRDDVIGNKRYRRGFRYKRWGYTIRKWIQSPIGLLQQVKIPRIRSEQNREIRLYMERYLCRSREMEEILLEGYLWGMSSRRLRLWSKRVFGEGLSHNSICHLRGRIREQVNRMREDRIGADIKVLVVDGISVRYRRRGRGVVLVALGVDIYGQAILLDWMGCEVESGANWRLLFRRLRFRGLESVDLIVSDGAPGISEAFRQVWKDPTPLHQPCLWHISRDLSKMLNDNFSRRHFLRDYWEVFDGLDLDEAQMRLVEFYQKWETKEPAAIHKLMEYGEAIFLYYDYPESWRHRLRTTNLAEGFFSHLRTFLRRFPGWIDEDHIVQIIGIFLIGMRVFRNNSKNYHAQRLPDSLFNPNFNRMA